MYFDLDLSKPVIIYHSKDIDGKSARSLAMYYIKKYQELNDIPSKCKSIGYDYCGKYRILFNDTDRLPENNEYITYNDIINQYKEKPSTVFVLDVSIRISLLNELLQNGINVIWCDHHITTLHSLRENNCIDEDKVSSFITSKSLGYNNNSYAIFNLNQNDSGVFNTWKTLYGNEPVPEFIKCISAYDTWNQELDYFDDGKCLNSYFWTVTDNYETEMKELIEEHFSSSNLKYILDNPKLNKDVYIYKLDKLRNSIIEGRQIYRYNQIQNKENALKFAFTLKWKNYKFIAINDYGNSDTLSSLFNSEIYDGMLLYNQYPDGKWKVSMYGKYNSEKDFTPIAKEYGGGGHPLACGFYIDNLPWAKENISDLEQ